MCKFCNSLKEKTIVSYDNRASMNISYGQRQGVNVYGDVYIKGNMLSIKCSGSYRSSSDCYYESWDIDCDDEYSSDSEPNYIQIQYCPFCGCKLKDHTYEIQKANDDIKNLKYDLKWLEQDLRDYSIIVNCIWECNKRILHNVEVWPGHYGDRTEYDYIEYDNDNPLTINQIKKKYPKINFNISYGKPQNDWNKYIYAELPILDLTTKIRCNWSGRGQWHAISYKLTDEMYFEFVKLGYIKHNEKKYNELKKNQENILNKITNTKEEIKRLEHYLETL